MPSAVVDEGKQHKRCALLSRKTLTTIEAEAFTFEEALQHVTPGKSTYPDHCTYADQNQPRTFRSSADIPF